MTRFLVVAGLLVAATLAQSLQAQILPQLWIRPDFPLVLVLAWAMLRGSNEGAVAGFLGGLLLDSLMFTPFGLNAALLGIIGYCTGLGETNLYRGNVPFFFATGAAATLLYHLLMFLALQAFGVVLPPLTVTLKLAIPAAALNAALLVPAFLISRRLLRALGGWQQIRL